MSKTDEFNRTWITENAIDICSEYDHGVLTLRALHYQLVGRGMTNSMQHYKRVVEAMIKARWDGLIAFSQFSDHDREVIGKTDFETTDVNDSIETAKRQIQAWMTVYGRNRWDGQPIVPEVWIEKKALQGIFGPVCRDNSVALAPCKGYPSLTFLHESVARFEAVYANGQTPMILYFGDYDATGEDIPRSISENLQQLGIRVRVKVVSLLHEQVLALGLPAAPTKKTDSRAASWDGIGQVELDAVKPELLEKMCQEAIDDVFDDDIYEAVKAVADAEKRTYQSELKAFVNNLK